MLLIEKAYPSNGLFVESKKHAFFVPREILHIILKKLPFVDLIQASLCCRLWRQLSEERIWKLCCKREGLKRKSSGVKSYREAYFSSQSRGEGSPSTFGPVDIFGFCFTNTKGVASALDYYQDRLICGYGKNQLYFAAIADRHERELGMKIPESIERIVDIRLLGSAVYFASKDKIYKGDFTQKKSVPFLEDFQFEGNIYSIEIKGNFLFILFEDSSLKVFEVASQLVDGAVNEENSRLIFSKTHKGSINDYHLNGDFIAISGQSGTSCTICVCDYKKNQTFETKIKGTVNILKLQENFLIFGLVSGEVFVWRYQSKIYYKIFEEKNASPLFFEITSEGVITGFSNGKLRMIAFRSDFAFCPKRALMFLFKDGQDRYIGGHSGKGNINLCKISQKKRILNLYFTVIKEIEIYIGFEKMAALRSRLYFTAISFKKDYIITANSGGEVKLFKLATYVLSDLIKRTAKLAIATPQFSKRKI